MWSRSPELSPVKLIFDNVYDSEYGLQINRGTQVLWSRSPELSPGTREFDDAYEYEYGLQIALMSECRVWIILRFVKWNIISALEDQSKRTCATIECCGICRFRLSHVVTVTGAVPG